MTLEPKRSLPVGLLVIGLLLLTAAGLLLFLPMFQCPICGPLLKEVDVEMKRNPTPELAEYRTYAYAEMPCGYCDQRRRVRFMVWYKGSNRR